MIARQMIILLKIGKIDISNKCVASVTVERNFSDVGDKFSIDLVDSPDSNVTYDLELYMAAGYRDISLKYGDISSSDLVSYTGTIWGYTNTFVGNMKKLTITGIMNRYINNSHGAAAYAYNIDWNSYFNKRVNTTLPYGTINALLVRKGLVEKYTNIVYNIKRVWNSDKTSYEETITTTTERSSDILYSDYKTALKSNTDLALELTGPGGSIHLPVPDSFFEITTIPADLDNYNKKQYKEFDSVVNDSANEIDSKFWGPLTRKQTTAPEARMDHICPELAHTKLIFKPDKDFIGPPNPNDPANVAGFIMDMNPNGIKTTSKYFLLNSICNEIHPKDDWIKNPVVIQGVYPNGMRSQDPNLFPKIYPNGDNVYFNSEGAQCAFTYTSRDGSPVSIGPFIAVKKGDYDFALPRVNAVKVTPTKNDMQAEQDDDLNNYYYYDKDNNLRAFIIHNPNTNKSSFYVQANPEKPNFGAAGILNSGTGVNISEIVKQLCILEGWKTKDEYIVQTEMVPNSEAFIMQGQTAIEFIQNNLVPRSITPLGKYKVNTEDGYKVINRPQGGFYPFFDSDGYFHYQPLTDSTTKDLDIGPVGYNLPDSPVISFQINTKGTAFYTYSPVKYNAMTITTGKEIEEVEVLSEAVSNQIENAKGHNDTFDAWLGLTYDDVKRASTNDSSATANYNVALKLAKEALVTKPTTKLVGSAAYNDADVRGNLITAKDNIKKTTIKATMNLWGNTKIAPARNITVTNMLKGGTSNSSNPVIHPSSGKYLILSMTDKIDSGGFIQSLNLLRYTDDLKASINESKIDYSVAATYNIPLTTETKNIEDVYPE